MIFCFGLLVGLLVALGFPPCAFPPRPPMIFCFGLLVGLLAMGLSSVCLLPLASVIVGHCGHLGRAGGGGFSSCLLSCALVIFCFGLWGGFAGGGACSLCLSPVPPMIFWLVLEWLVLPLLFGGWL